jgi:hypothetical protein
MLLNLQNDGTKVDLDARNAILLLDSAFWHVFTWERKALYMAVGAMFELSKHNIRAAARNAAISARMREDEGHPSEPQTEEYHGIERSL